MERIKKELRENFIIDKPWGSYIILKEENNYKVKKITVMPWQSLSLQLHNHRSEHWVVVRGIATVIIGDDEERIVCENQCIYVSRKMKHRILNNSENILEIIEVQYGEYVGEDDIIRFEDKYDRIKIRK